MRRRRRNGKNSNCQFSIPANLGIVTFSLQKVPESTSDSGGFPYAVLSLVFELQQHLEAQPYPEMNS